LKLVRTNTKYLIFTVIPLVITLFAVSIITLGEFRTLSIESEEHYRNNVIESRQRELKNYVDIVRGAIDNIYQHPNLPLEDKQERVKRILANMRFGQDGYFFAYTYEGVNLVLPGQEWRVGKNWYELEDVNGTKIIQALINQGLAGGGYSKYIFNRPSQNGEVSKKIAYSEALTDWQWIFGTGVYIDDIDSEVQRINSSISDNIDSTFRKIFLIGLVSVVLVFITSQFIRLSERRIANQKLRNLNQRIFATQEEECRRFSRELHDGVSQTVAAARFSLETAQLKQQSNADPSVDIEHAIGIIRKIMIDIRGISHRLHPSILESYGLGAALQELGTEFSERTGIEVVVKRLSVRNVLSDEMKTTLYRIAQEGMSNIERHADATNVSISLQLDDKWLVLSIVDDGKGFNCQHIEKASKSYEGIGLRNIEERLHFYKGELIIKSDNKNTGIYAKIPKSQLRYKGDRAHHPVEDELTS
jgi:two-component system NarL family sensor kinase